MNTGQRGIYSMDENIASECRDDANAWVSVASELRQECGSAHPSSYGRMSDARTHIVKYPFGGKLAFLEVLVSF